MNKEKDWKEKAIQEWQNSFIDFPSRDEERERVESALCFVEKEVERLKRINETIIGIRKQICDDLKEITKERDNLLADKKELNEIIEKFQEQGNAKGREDKELVSSEIVRANSKDLTSSQDSPAQNNQEQEAKK